MELGIVGLGRMGSNIARRLLRQGHQVVGFDRNPEAVAALVQAGGRGAGSISELRAQLQAPAAIWIMLPAGEATEAAIRELAGICSSGDVLVDGGNGHFKDDIRRAKELTPRGIAYLDAGTSGGVFGLDRGFCLMVGGDAEAVRRLDLIFAALAPGAAAGTRTPGRQGEFSPAEHGYVHAGPAGAGHFTKMVHNGIDHIEVTARLRLLQHPFGRVDPMMMAMRG